ncbi:MAG TPA: zinc-ribbon domain-containing protein [Bacilli bacterium]|nr:zinc-ribbon domain-containing protein [Bacilli bacterium]
MEKEYKDITLTCKDCGKEFVFTAGEQKFYDEKGFTNQPQRCKECRDAKKANRNNYRNNRYNDNDRNN